MEKKEGFLVIDKRPGIFGDKTSKVSLITYVSFSESLFYLRVKNSCAIVVKKKKKKKIPCVRLHYKVTLFVNFTNQEPTFVYFWIKSTLKWTT